MEVRDTWRRQGDALDVNIEAVPDRVFIERVGSFDTITKARVRFVRPNPGWLDLEKELGREASESDAHRVDVEMTARRNSSLDKDSGIIGAIYQMFRERSLDYAVVEGKVDGEKQTINTERLGVQEHRMLPVDHNGKVLEAPAWEAIDNFYEKLGE